VAVISGPERLTYQEFATLVGRFAATLRRQGVKRGDVVSIMAPNRAEMLAAHYAVPMVGAVLGAINTRLEAATVGYILEHSGSRLLIVDSSCVATAGAAVRSIAARVQMLVLDGEGTPGETGSFEALIQEVEPEPIDTKDVADEWQPICLNYTSGTTGRPKGVVYHHRGAYLNALGNVISLGFTPRTVYLWTLPMFHCNGWCHTWAVTAAGGTHVCLERVDPALIFRAIEEHGVTHFCCAPVVLYMLLNHADRRLRNPAHRITVGTGGAAPTSTLIEELDALGVDLVHLYGLTESFGPATFCALQNVESAMTASDKARVLARQGVRHPTASRVGVVDPAGREVPSDGASMGEIVLRGNTLMAGYYRDEEATEAAFGNGVLHTGDLAVCHPNGHIEIKDRSKDIIISGGENISSLEVENVLHQHPTVLIAAVVAVADAKWGEVPWACIELKAGVAAPSAEELMAFCRERLAGFKVPRRFIFRELPKTATGKIQKFALRAELKA
jgi:fatty-acyl-CoA synthase